MSKNKIVKLKHNENIKNVKMCVYRYTDKNDGIVKYIGIVHKGDLEKRLNQHMLQDYWYLDGLWKVDYFECDTRSEAEAFESHLIALYRTGEYYNRAKTRWGTNKYLPNTDGWWKKAADSIFADKETVIVVKAIKKAIKQGNRQLARELLDLLEVSFE